MAPPVSPCPATPFILIAQVHLSPAGAEQRRPHRCCNHGNRAVRGLLARRDGRRGGPCQRACKADRGWLLLRGDPGRFRGGQGPVTDSARGEAGRIFFTCSLGVSHGPQNGAQVPRLFELFLFRTFMCCGVVRLRVGFRGLPGHAWFGDGCGLSSGRHPSAFGLGWQANPVGWLHT